MVKDLRWKALVERTYRKQLYDPYFPCQQQKFLLREMMYLYLQPQLCNPPKWHPKLQWLQTMKRNYILCCLKLGNCNSYINSNGICGVCNKCINCWTLVEHISNCAISMLSSNAGWKLSPSKLITTVKVVRFDESWWSSVVHIAISGSSIDRLGKWFRK